MLSVDRKDLRRVTPSTFRESLSPHFRRYEFACRGTACCGHSAVVDPMLVWALEEFREAIAEARGMDTPIRPESAFRCLTHNREEGSDDDSQHVIGRAVDIHTIPGLTTAIMAEVADSVSAFRQGGIGLYDWGIHVDVRKKGRARWNYQTG